jgi:cysteinyl-tRNA synthetase
MSQNTDFLDIPKLPLHFFNTETRTKEVFAPHHDNHVKMYTCGPTVYHYAHIGNFRTYVFEDLLRRTLKFFGFQVTQVMNITDIDDKTIKGAIANKIPLKEFTQPFLNAFFVDMQHLGIEKVEHYPLATDYIPQMIDFIQKLIDAGVAYQSKDQSIYFSIDKCPKYGRLSHLKLDELKVGARETRVASDEYEKETLSDFVLWKAYEEDRDGDIFWESPFGKGRPGWHLECSTMATEILGPSLDLHLGGVDNIFPHHENEIAQSECCTNKTFVKMWMHVEHLLVNHKKMSKSLGNFYTLRDLLDKGYGGMEVRYLLLQAHYRTQLNFTLDGLEAAKHSLQRLNDFAARMKDMAEETAKSSSEATAAIKKAMQTFCESLSADMNISPALAALFDLMHEINVLHDKKILTPKDAKNVLTLLEEFNRVLGVFTFAREEEFPTDLIELLEQRQSARKEKNFKLADECRKTIEERGYVIEDTPQGPRLKKKS